MAGQYLCSKIHNNGTDFVILIKNLCQQLHLAIVLERLFNVDANVLLSEKIFLPSIRIRKEFSSNFQFVKDQSKFV